MKEAEISLQEYMIDGYLPTIGIECHVQLNTVSKLFTAISNQVSPDQGANTLVGPVCLGLPGVLPVINDGAIDMAILAGLALEAEIASSTSFDRKHYFYPDLPLGYQISQHYQPIIRAGCLEIPTDWNQSFSVRIERAHLEADAGKLTHSNDENYSLVDLNRVGSPLLEIVSQPDIHNSLQAKRYAKELYLRMIYAQVCDGDLSAGNLRFDVNISLSSNLEELGTRTEIKNLNSFRFIEQAVNYEIRRQLEILKAGQSIKQETRGWDEVKKQTFSQRSKEDAQDYRYMPDPDLPPLVIEPARVTALKDKLPLTPKSVRLILEKWQISFAVSEVLLDYPSAAKLLLDLSADLEINEIKLIVNWLSGDVLALINKKEIVWADVLDACGGLQALARLKNRGEISSTTVKEWLPQILIKKADPKTLLRETGQTQISDLETLRVLVKKVFAENPQAVSDARAESKAAGFLIGRVMKLSQGSADPRLVAELVREFLNQ